MKWKIKTPHAALRFGLVALGAATLLTSSMAPLHAEVSINCDASGVDLQKKLDAASTGGTVVVRGTCDDGPYHIGSKDLTLLGGRATLSAPDGGIVLEVRNAGVLLENLDIVGGDEDGIFVVNGSVTLFQVTIKDAMGSAMHLSESSFANIESSEFDGNALGLLFTENSSFIMGDTSITNNDGPGIHMSGGGSGSFFPGNVIDGNDDGVSVQLTSSLRMSGATITNNTGSGVRAARFGAVAFESPNTFADNAIDVQCMEAGGVFANEPQISDDGLPGNLVDDGSCTIIGIGDGF